MSPEHRLFLFSLLAVGFSCSSRWSISDTADEVPAECAADAVGAGVGCGEDDVDSIETVSDPEGEASRASSGCIGGTIAERCMTEYVSCPSIDAAVELLAQYNPGVVWRTHCETDEGRSLVSVSAGFGGSEAYIYDADSDELVSVYYSTDVPIFCESTAYQAFYGLPLSQCLPDLALELTPECPTDVSSFEEDCVVVL